MDALLYLIPIALTLGLIGLVAFVWTLKSGQLDDPEGNAARILGDDSPLPDKLPNKKPDKPKPEKKP